MVIGWEHGANDAAHKEGAPVDWEPGGHDIGQHDKDGACVVSASIVMESGYQHRMDGQSLSPKIDTHFIECKWLKEGSRGCHLRRDK